jgi:copper chaperone CopZ
MRQLFLPIIVSLLLLADASFARTVEVEVHGMTCAFCVDSLERKFRKMDSVKEVQVSLKVKLIRLETDESRPTIESIKRAVLDAGFTPAKITVLE